MIKKIILASLFLLLTACTKNVAMLQPNDPYHKATLKVNKPYKIPHTFWKLGFTISATNYNATMRDDNGVYFAAPAPIIAYDPIIGTVFRSGGLYYQISPTKDVFLYLIDTNRFAGATPIKPALNGLDYKIIK